MIRRRRTARRMPNNRLVLTRIIRYKKQLDLGAEVKLSASAIYGYEAGLMNPRQPGVAKKIGERLGVDSDWLFEEAKASSHLERLIDQLIEIMDHRE